MCSSKYLWCQSFVCMMTIRFYIDLVSGRALDCIETWPCLLQKSAFCHYDLVSTVQWFSINIIWQVSLSQVVLPAPHKLLFRIEIVPITTDFEDWFLDALVTLTQGLMNIFNWGDSLTSVDDASLHPRWLKPHFLRVCLRDFSDFRRIFPWVIIFFFDCDPNIMFR